MSRRDLAGLGLVAALLAATLLYRQLFIEPRAWGALCLAAEAPLACAPRAALLWLQHWQLWGGAALALGLWAFLGAPFAIRVAAVALGAIAIVNYNATWGMLGAALGAWVWLLDQPQRASGAAAGTPPAKPCAVQS
jgi:hypothetical protein